MFQKFKWGLNGIMEISLESFLLISPLFFLAGLVDAIAGGGGLLSLPAYLFTGLPVHNAIATNKMAAAMGTGLSTYRYIKRGYVPLKLGLFCLIFGLIGSAIGAKIALMISDEVFKKIMLFIVPLTGLYLLTKGDLTRERKSLSQGRQILLSMPIAFFLGIYDGFYGPGMGTFLMIALTSLVHLDIKQANGICKIINMSTNVAALSVYLLSGKVLLVLGLSAGLIQVLGNYVGARYFESGHTRFIKPLMLTVLSLFFIKLVTELGVLS